MKSAPFCAHIANGGKIGRQKSVSEERFSNLEEKWSWQLRITNFLYLYILCFTNHHQAQGFEKKVVLVQRNRPQQSVNQWNQLYTVCNYGRNHRPPTTHQESQT